MRYRYTKHTFFKINLLKHYRFVISKAFIENTIAHPKKCEHKADRTYIAMAAYDDTHVLRVVYRVERDIIIIITLYPGRTKSYEI